MTPSGPLAIQFGTGRLVVSTATSDALPDAHLVIINQAVEPGPVGEIAHDRESRSAFRGDEIVLAFPTAEQADRVANALCNVPVLQLNAASKTIHITKISDALLRDLFTTEQITPQRYVEEVRRRDTERAEAIASATISKGGDHG